MKKNREQDKPIELRSEELQDIIGRIPTCFERNGILVATVIVIVLISGTYFFQYPDTLDAHIVITNSTPAADVVARSAGYIEYIYDKNGEHVDKGELLGVIANNANYEDVIWLENLLSGLDNGEINLEDFIKSIDARKPVLGDMQHYYISMYNAAKNLFLYNTYRFYDKKREFAKKRINQRNELELREDARHELVEEIEKIKGETFIRDSVMYASGMLSDESYGKARQNYLESCRGPIDRDVEEMHHKIQHTTDEETLISLAHEQFLTSNSYGQTYYSSLRDMDMALKNWEKIYVMRSPVDGVLNMMGLYGKNRFVNNGETVFVITPENREDPIGKALLPASGTGKIKKGQRVIVCVNNYPEEEFGSLTGYVSTISNAPTSDGNYIVDVVFPHGLETAFHRQIPSSQQLIGTAKLILKERRLVELFIQPIRNLLKKNIQTNENFIQENVSVSK